MNLSPMKLAEISRVSEGIRELLGDDFDAETFTDTLDGETDVMDMIGATLAALAEAEAFETANKEAAQTYTDRARAIKARQDSLRAALARLVEATGEKTIRHAFATLTLSQGKEKPVVTDESRLPRELGKETWKPSLTAIREANYRGEGVAWSNAGPTLTIRRT